MGAELFSALNFQTGVINPIPSPGTTRGVSVVITDFTGLNLNAVAATTLVTLPSSGFTHLVMTELYCYNFSMASTTATVSWGSSGTPTDFAAAAALTGAGVGKMVPIYANAGAATYAPGTSLVANVTIAQGVAATCDVVLFGVFD